jgi:hypothetical protein
MNPNSPNQPQQTPGAPAPYAGQQPAAVPYPPQGQPGQVPMPAPPPVPVGGVPPAPLVGQAAPVDQPGASPVIGQPTGDGSNPGTKAALDKSRNSTQNMLQIAEIRDGFVIMNDGSFRSVVMVNSINFDLMSQGEQEAVEYNYQNFLNSLFFPIQIFLRSQKVDLTPYIEKLDKIRSEHDNMLLALLMDDYIGYMEQLSEQTNIMDKKFYIIIPFFPHIDIQKAFTQSKNFVTGVSGLFNKKEDHVVINEADLEKAKTELKNRVQTVLDGLLQCNVQALPLDTQELIELYYDTYNPDTATRQQLKNFDDMNADFVTKGKGNASQPQLEKGY